MDTGPEGISRCRVQFVLLLSFSFFPCRPAVCSIFFLLILATCLSVCVFVCVAPRPFMRARLGSVSSFRSAGLSAAVPGSPIDNERVSIWIAVAVSIAVVLLCSICVLLTSLCFPLTLTSVVLQTRLRYLVRVMAAEIDHTDQSRAVYDAAEQYERAPLSSFKSLCRKYEMGWLSYNECFIWVCVCVCPCVCVCSCKTVIEDLRGELTQSHSANIVLKEARTDRQTDFRLLCIAFLVYVCVLQMSTYCCNRL